MVQEKLVFPEKTNGDDRIHQDEPQLRFKEFTEPFKEVLLGDISSDGMYGMNCAAKEFDGENKYIRITDIDENSHNFVPNPLSSPDGVLEDKFLLKENDIVFARTGASTGKSYLYDKNDGKLYFAGFLIKLEITNAYAPFVYYNTLRENYDNWVSIMSVRSGQPGINLEEYKKFKINLPSFEEQKKISSFLSAVDKKIELLEKKYENTLNLKKSISENLLNRTFSFEKSKNDWEEVKLDFILKERKEYADKKSDYPHVTLSKDGIFPKTEEYDREFLVKDENKKYKVTHLNDICYNPANLKFGVITLNKFGSAIFSPIYVTFEVKNANTEYVAYSLIRNNFINKIRKYEEGTVYERMAVKPSDFLKGTILLPPLKEQEKISNILNQLNEQLNLIDQELNLIKSFRKGLLQKMFV